MAAESVFHVQAMIKKYPFTPLTFCTEKYKAWSWQSDATGNQEHLNVVQTSTLPSASMTPVNIYNRLMTFSSFTTDAR